MATLIESSRQMRQQPPFHGCPSVCKGQQLFTRLRHEQKKHLLGEKLTEGVMKDLLDSQDVLRDVRRIWKVRHIPPDAARASKNGIHRPIEV